VVEDCADSQRLVARALAPELRVLAAATIAEARRRLERRLPALVLLDLSLPDGDGHHFCSELRADPLTRRIPVIFLSGSEAVSDKVVAFSLGAEDYVEKPFDAIELRARVMARIAKAKEASESAGAIELPGIRLDAGQVRAFAAEARGERDLGLTAAEFRILALLAGQPERVFTRAQVMEAAWGGTTVAERTVDSHVCNLRRKLEALRSYVESVRGVGYRLVVAKHAGARVDSGH
jgi:two-component system phosphate regulon response regulator PhoB